MSIIKLKIRYKNKVRRGVNLTLALLGICLASFSFAGGKLVGTSGVSQVEGSGGGGMVPWATLSGYDTQDEQSATSFFSYIQVNDFSMRAWGASASYHDRFELSIARQTFHSQEIDVELSQNIIGFKAKLFGDLIYSSMPQISVGLQYKSAQHDSTLEALKAEKDTGLDLYVATTKAWLDGPFHRNLVLNATVRLTKANQVGLQGFGGDKKDSYSAVLETSVGLFLNRNWVVGAEYRQKPDNLSAVKEDDWSNVFVAFVPNKKVAITTAIVDLGRLAGFSRQRGMYTSIQVAF